MAITVQPASSSLAASVPAGNAYHNASAGISVPAEFNRQIGLPALPPNPDTVTNFVVRQGAVDSIVAALTDLPTTVTNTGVTHHTLLI